MIKHKESILIAASMDDVGSGAILYGIKIAQITNTELVIFSVHPEGATQSDHSFETEFNTFTSNICGANNFISYKTEIGKGYLPEAATEYAIQIDAQSVIFGLRPPAGFNPFYGVKFIKATKKLQCPFLVVQDNNPSQQLFENLYIPVSHKKEGKEKLIWAETFCLDKPIKIKLVPAKAEEPLSKAIIQNHLNFACRQLEAANIPFEIIQGSKNSNKIDQEVIQIAAKNKDGMVVITATKHYGPEQEILGPPELKAITNKEMVPILCVNPRKDLHVLYSKY